MATYTITLNERTASGKALMSYLQALGVLVEKISPKTKSSYRRSQEDKSAGRVETFSSSEGNENAKNNGQVQVSKVHKGYEQQWIFEKLLMYTKTCLINLISN